MEVKDARPPEASRGYTPAGHHPFDELTRALTVEPPSRRQALRLLAGGTLAAVFAWSVGAKEAGAVEALRNDRSCAGDPVISNRRCPRRIARCGGRRFCTCARAVGGDKKCVDLRTAHCPNVDECDSNSDCPSSAVCVKVGGCCRNRRRNACWRQCP
jgi:hypothetical protein